MFKLKPKFPLGAFTKEWPGFSLAESYTGELISVAYKLEEEEEEFVTNFAAALGGAIPKPNQMTAIDGGVAIWSGQDQYMLLLSEENVHADEDVSEKLGGAAYTTLQSDGWASLSIKGERALDVLERFIPLDLRGAPSNFAARTSAHHIAVIVLKFSDTQLQLLTPRSSSQSFLEGLEHVAENVLS